MLIEFRVKNFRSFKEEQVFSMVASNDDSLSDNVVEVAGWRLLRTAAIYGANASGKSNLVKAIRVMTGLIRLSAQLNSEPLNHLVPFALDSETRDQPCRFEITFLLDEVRYQYGFSATRKRIHDEWLYSYPEGRPRKLFERKLNPKTQKPEWDLESRNLTGQKKKIKDMVRDDALFLSVAAQFNHEQLTPIYHYLGISLRTILPDDLSRKVTAEMLDVDTDKEEGNLFRQAVTIALKSCDFGISGVSVKAVNPEAPEIPEFYPPDMRKQLMEEFASITEYEVTMTHTSSSGDQNIAIPYEEESDGTRRFFELLGPWLQTLNSGFNVFVDELGRSLHPLLAQTLIRLVHSTKNSHKSTQVITTTHDTTLLVPELFRRDQIWFTEKDNDGATHLYSMSDYKENEKGKVRKDEAFQKRYLEGRYGAIPIIERFD